MHDPHVVAFELRRPLPRRDHWTAERFRRAGKPVPWFHWENYGRWWKPGDWSPFAVLFRRGWYFPAILVVWHVEPGGADSGEVCPHHHRWQDARGKWHAKRVCAWRWHVHHWKIQLPPYQAARRWLLTRCEWCGGKSRKGDVINVSTRGWDAGQPAKWWQGEQGVVHMECSSIEHAHRTCTCAVPVLRVLYPGHRPDYGQCVSCGRFRAWRPRGERDPWAEVARWVQANVPVGGRFTPEQRATWKAMCAAAKAEREAADA